MLQEVLINEVCVWVYIGGTVCELGGVHMFMFSYVGLRCMLCFVVGCSE